MGEIESSRGSRHSALLRRPVNHISAIPHSDIVREPTYRSNSCCKQVASDSENDFILGLRAAFDAAIASSLL